MESIESPSESVSATGPTQATTVSSTSNTGNSVSVSAADSSNLATAVAVEDEPVVVADPVDVPNEEKKKSNTLAFVFTLVAIVVIVLAVVFSPSGDSKTDVIPTESSESVSTQTPPEGDDGSKPSTSVEADEQRREDMIGILESLYEDSEGGVAVFNASSPFASQDRIDALEWIVKIDKSYVETSIPSSYNEEDKYDFEQMVYQVRQRYIMALLYMATNGQDWTQQCNFLSESNECEWRINNRLDKVLGATCNDAGQIEKLSMWWIGMSGTFPHELSFFSESLTDMNVPGGSVSGPIPSSFEKLTNMEVLVLSDNCLSGDLPQGINTIDMPNLGILSIGQNNYGLRASSGSMETFCDGAGNLKEGVQAAAIDCPVEEFGYDEFGNATRAPWGCDCCVCCFPEKYECEHPIWGSWKTHYLRGADSDESPPAGFESKCITEEQVSWIAENCPCVINVGDALSIINVGNYRECTTDCTQANAVPSYDFGS